MEGASSCLHSELVREDRQHSKGLQPWLQDEGLL